MEIAALILSIFALSISLTTLVWLLAKHFSSFKIQYVPLEDQFAKELDPQPPEKNNPPMAEIYKTIDDLEPDEEEYFKKYNLKTKQQV